MAVLSGREPRVWPLILTAMLLGQMIWSSSALSATGAAAQAVSGPRETVDQSFTTTRPNSPTGLSYSGTYHAAGDENGDPPYLKRMIVYPPPGMRYDASVPDQCGAPDPQLELMGAAACPAGSRLGGGSINGSILDPVLHTFTSDFEYSFDVLNNANEQLILVNSGQGRTVVHVRIRPDGAFDALMPTCFPWVETAGCADNFILVRKDMSSLPRYTRTIGGRLRSYATTPPKCPTRGYWQTRMEIYWSDGSVDSVESPQPCQHAR